MSNYFTIPDQSSRNQITLRLFLVRHGETVANLKNIVVGQTDSVGKKRCILRVMLIGGNSIKSSSDLSSCFGPICSH
jgi:broad specificity phosphatase PhoE